MKGVNYNKLKKFDLGKININPGYQTNTNAVNTGSFQSTSGYDMSNDISTMNRSVLPQAIGKAGSIASTLGSIYSNTLTQAQADAANIAASGISEAALTQGAKEAGVSLSEYAADAAKGATGSSVAKGSLSTLGKIAAGAGAAYGAFNMANDFISFGDRLRGADLQNMSGTSTQSKYGVNYTAYNGFDQDAVRKYTSAQNTSGTLNSTMDGISTGASVGSLFSPIGTAIGAGIGGLVGLVGGLFGGISRKRKVERDMQNTLIAQAGYNDQAESEAGSQGLRNKFYTNGADKGKRPGESLSGGKYGLIETPSGTAYGEVKGLASPDEGEIDMATGETHYNGSKNMNVNDKRADIVPVGITGYANGGAFDNNVGIPGHELDVNGMTFADNARPLFKQNEQLKDADRAIDMQIEQNNNHKNRDKATTKFIDNKLNKMKEQISMQYRQNSQQIADIVNRQTAMSYGQYDCGKRPRYWSGKPFATTELGTSPVWSVMQGLPYAMAESIAANKETPYAQNSFVSNATAPAALRTLGSLRYDPTQQLRQITTTNRQGLYNINNAGSLTAGQRAALASSANIQSAQQRNAIYDQAQQINNQYKGTYANALMNYGNAEATRQQQALATQQENYRQAVGAKQRWQAQARKNWYTIGRQGLQDWNTMLNAQAMLNLYDRQITNEEKALAWQMGNGGLGTNAEKDVPYTQTPVYASRAAAKRNRGTSSQFSPDPIRDTREGAPLRGNDILPEFFYLPWYDRSNTKGSDPWVRKNIG